MNEYVAQALAKETERNKIMGKINNLGLQDEVAKLIADKELKNNTEKIASLFPIKPAIDGHTIDMKINGRNIYDNLEKNQEIIATVLANQFTPEQVTEKLANLKQDPRLISIQNRFNKLAPGEKIDGKVIVIGDKTNGLIPGVIYRTGEGYTLTSQDRENTKALIKSIQDEFCLRDPETKMLYALIIGLGKYSPSHCSNYSSMFAIGLMSDDSDDISCIYVEAGAAGFKSGSKNLMLPQL